MEFLGFLDLALRHKVRVFSFVAFLLIFTLITSYMITPPYKAVLFTTIVPSSSSSQDFHYDGFYAVEASEKFAETVAGWAKNPSLLDRISEDAGIDVGNTVSVSPQKKQNIVISVKAKSFEDAEKLADSTEKIFNEELDKYNNESKRFSFVPFSKKIKFQEIVFLALILGGILLGFFFGILSAFLSEFLKGKVSFAETIEETLGLKVISQIPRDWNSRDLQILKAFISNQRTKVQILGINVKVKAIADELNCEYLSFPEQSKKLNSHKILAFVALGETRLDSIKTLKSLGEKEIFIVLFK